MRSMLFAMALAVFVPSVAYSKTVFTVHHGTPSVLHGGGGKSLRSHGITVWTQGMPTSNFRVLGVIEDVHTDKALASQPLQSPVSASIANLVRANGGDAVLVWDSNAKLTDVERRKIGGFLGTNAFSIQSDVLVQNVASRLVVIKSNVGL